MTDYRQILADLVAAHEAERFGSNDPHTSGPEWALLLERRDEKVAVAKLLLAANATPAVDELVALRAENTKLRAEIGVLESQPSVEDVTLEMEEVASACVRWKPLTNSVVDAVNEMLNELHEAHAELARLREMPTAAEIEAWRREAVSLTFRQCMQEPDKVGGETRERHYAKHLILKPKEIDAAVAMMKRASLSTASQPARAFTKREAEEAIVAYGEACGDTDSGRLARVDRTYGRLREMLLSVPAPTAPEKPPGTDLSSSPAPAAAPDADAQKLAEVTRERDEAVEERNSACEELNALATLIGARKIAAVDNATLRAVEKALAAARADANAVAVRELRLVRGPIAHTMDMAKHNRGNVVYHLHCDLHTIDGRIAALSAPAEAAPAPVPAPVSGEGAVDDAVPLRAALRSMDDHMTDSVEWRVAVGRAISELARREGKS